MAPPRPYTALATGYGGGNYGYKTGGPLTYSPSLLRPPRPPKPRIISPAPTTGYAPGGVQYAPIPPSQRVGAGGAPLAAQGGHTGGGAGTGAGHATTPPAAPGGDTPPWMNDPVYQQIVAMANKNVQGAQAAATASQQQTVEALGDPNLAISLGLGNLVAQTAQANPFSTLKNLLRGHNANVQKIDQSMNQANLWSSSTRQRGQQQEGVGYLGGVSDATGRAQATLAQIAAQLLAARQAAAAQIAAAAGDAYGRHKDDTPPTEPPPPAPKPHVTKKPVQVAKHSTVGQLTGTPGYGGGTKPKKK